MRKRESTATRDVRAGGEGAGRPRTDAARKRAAVELIARHERTLKRTAQRFSLDAEDAEDAYQRALEILLVKAPTTDPRELIRWTRTVTKHEAIALRESRERLLGANVPRDADFDPLASIPARGDGPEERAARSEIVARGREALRALKPAELRALSLLASGHSYAEIGAITGFSQTKVNRVLAEGRERFRGVFDGSEDGTRCRELRPLLSAFCDGEASAADAATVRAHLRACAGCRATARAYRAAPRVVAGLAPALPASRSLLDRVHDALGGLWSRLPGAGGTADSAAGVAATGGTRGLGIAALAKLAAVCAGTVGGVACVATGVIPTPLVDREAPAIERRAERSAESEPQASEEPEPAPESPPQTEAPPRPKERESATRSAAPATGAVEYEAPPAAEAEAPAPSAPESPATSSSESTGSAAGEFGP